MSDECDFERTRKSTSLNNYFINTKCKCHDLTFNDNTRRIDISDFSQIINARLLNINVIILESFLNNYTCKFHDRINYFQQSRIWQNNRFIGESSHQIYPNEIYLFHLYLSWVKKIMRTSVSYEASIYFTYPKSSLLFPRDFQNTLYYVRPCLSQG